jgi:hypothetical protein
LAAALRVWAKGLLSAEAAVELLVGHRLWLFRGDFLGIAVEPGWEVFSGRVMAAVDFGAAVRALEAGVLPCPGGEGHVLRIAASIAEGVPVDLREAVTGLDVSNVVLAAEAMLHAGGHRRSVVTAGELAAR